MASAARKKKTAKIAGKATDPLQVFDFAIGEGKSDLSGSEEDLKEEETPIVEKGKKRCASAEDDMQLAVGNEVQTMLERFGEDISKAIQAKKKRLEAFTRTSLKGSTQKLEQLWKAQQEQRQKLTQDHCQQVASLLQLWENDAQRSKEQEDKLDHMDDMEKSHQTFLMDAQAELKNEMRMLQKKILMDTQKQEMATVRKSLQSMIF
ncbi:synaptonemal complex protein 3 isoform X2 [Brienomyrus brachyistius]|uniref:synaptonemal complex protein 3 isoform X2 n=1 Tax=Brienomyrus brachyistius TaxID=42636 RepID=UPI0020B37F11|nr:synaptonemal complex protein 3 isoform X2 [Brienomyrus brachyistius]